MQILGFELCSELMGSFRGDLRRDQCNLITLAADWTIENTCVDIHVRKRVERRLWRNWMMVWGQDSSGRGGVKWVDVEQSSPD